MRGIDTRNPDFVHYHTGPAAFTVGLAKAFSEHFKTESESHSGMHGSGLTLLNSKALKIERVRKGYVYSMRIASIIVMFKIIMLPRWISKDMRAGRFQPQTFAFQLKTGTVGFAPPGNRLGAAILKAK